MEHKTLKDLCDKFTLAFYKAYKEDRSKLGHFYAQDAVFTFGENKTFKGIQAIGRALLQEIKAKTITHKISSINFHSLGSSLVLLVTGTLLIDEEKNSLPFSETFILTMKNKQIVIQSDIFSFNNSF
jgi:hypothetical protein